MRCEGVYCYLPGETSRELDCTKEELRQKVVGTIPSARDTDPDFRLGYILEIKATRKDKGYIKKYPGLWEIKKVMGWDFDLDPEAENTSLARITLGLWNPAPQRFVNVRLEVDKVTLKDFVFKARIL